MALITEDLEIPAVSVLFPTTKRWLHVKPCGTSAAARRHLRRGEPIDDACRQAESRRLADYYAMRKARGDRLIRVKGKTLWVAKVQRVE